MSDSCDQCKKITIVHKCSRCKSVKYCSKDCQKAAWSIHKQQCKSVPTPIIEKNKLFQHPLQKKSLSYPANETIEEYMRNLGLQFSNIVITPFEHNIRCKDSFGMCATKDIAKGELIFRDQFMIKIPVYRRDEILISHLRFAGELISQCGDDTTKLEYWLRNLSMLHPRSPDHIHIKYTTEHYFNSGLFELYASNNQNFRRQLMTFGLPSIMKIVTVLRLNNFSSRDDKGWCISMAASMINHSCEPNAYYEVDEEHITIRAQKDIPEGNPITICYNDDWLDLPLKKRREEIKNSYYFDCGCERCIAEDIEQTLLRI